MELSILKSELLNALSITQGLTERKTTRPILGNLLLTAKDGKFSITASDLETSAVAYGAAKIKSPGATTVQGRVFAELVRELPDTEINLTLGDAERLEISAGNSKLRVVCVSANEYPGLPGLQVSVKSKVKAKDIAEMIGKTLYSTSSDETRYNLNGICLELDETSKKKLRMVATDGHRLAVISREVGEFNFEPKDGASSVICPRKGISEVKKIIESSELSEIGLCVKEGYFVIESGNFKLALRLVDGEFPDYSQVIPKKKGNVIDLDLADFTQALKRVALLVSDKGKAVRLDIVGDNLKISSSSPELGDAVEVIPVKYDRDIISIGFNARYLLDFCSSVSDSSEIVLELSNEFGPGKLYAPADESYYAVVMPLRVGGA